jgi:hypothetical protein
MVDVAGGVGDWVVHESSGRVFATLSDSNEVVEYSSTGEVRRLKVGEAPTEMILKGDRLIVACTKSPALHVIDLQKNAELGVIKVNGKGPYALFCSQVDNEYVYCICNTGDAWWDGEIFQADLKTLKVRKQQTVRGWGQSHAIHVVMSRDGKWIVPDARGASSPSGSDLMKVDEEELTFTQVRDYHKSFGQMVAGPMNRYWTFGNALYTLDITKKVRTFSGQLVAIHPLLDLAASTTSSGLALERFSDSSPIATVDLPKPADLKRDSSNRSRPRSIPAFQPTVQFDLQQNAVFVGVENRGYWVSLQEYRGELAPLMIVRAPSEVTSLVGRPLRIPLQVTNSDQQKTKLQIADGPKSATIAEGELVWQPGAEDVGFTTLQLELKSADDKTLDTVDMTVHVTLPKLDLGFHAKTMELAPSGRHLLVWGLAPGQEDRHPAHTGADDLAIIDLQKLKVLVRKTLPQGIRCATIDDKYVYLSPNSGNLFYRLDHTLTKSKRKFLQSPPQQLTKISATQLAIVGQQLQVFDTETLQTVASSNVALFNPSVVRVVQDLGNNEIQVANRVVDRRNGKTVRITGFVNLPSLVQNNVRMNYNPMDRNQTPPRRGRRLNGNNLVNHKGSQIAQWSGQRLGIISDRWPMAVLIASSQEGRTTNTRMELCNLIDGTVEHSSIIHVSSANQNRAPSFYGSRNMLRISGDTVLYLQGTQLLLATVPPAIAKAMPVPTHFLQQQQAEIEVAERTKFLLAVGGKREGATFSLLAEYPGVELDPKSGELSIETQSLWDQFINRAAAESAVGTFPRRNQPVPTSRLENAKQYKSLTGKDLPANKLAVQLPVSAVLQDPEGQEDGIQFSVIFVGPRKKLDDAIKAKNAERLAAMEEAKRKQEEARARQVALREAEMKHRAQTGEGEKGVAERLAEVEGRMRRLEAALDSILKRLEEKQDE